MIEKIENYLKYFSISIHLICPLIYQFNNSDVGRRTLAALSINSFQISGILINNFLTIIFVDM